MFKEIELRAIFEVIHHIGAQPILLYAEEREEHSFEFVGRQEHCEIHYDEGTRLELKTNDFSKHITIDSLSTPEILKLILAERSERTADSDQVTPPSVTVHTSALARQSVLNRKSELTGVQDLALKRSRLEQAMRKAAFNLDESPPPRVFYQESHRRFLSCQEAGLSQQGKETYAELTADFRMGSKRVKLSRLGSDLERFWDRLESDPCFWDPVLRKGWENPWPTPRGVLPVLWSQESVAKLLSVFLCVVEAERVKAGHSLIGNWKSPLPLKFELEDRPSTSLGSIDQAGILKNRRSLISEGMPSGFLLGSPGTGHVRRPHYLSEAVTGFWNITLESAHRKPQLLSELNLGIWVQDLHIDRFNPLTGDMELTLSNAALIHHGEIGETVLPTTLRCSILDLFTSWDVFSTSEFTLGYWFSKNSNPFITEFNVPLALSPKFFIPGTVSPSHYW